MMSVKYDAHEEPLDRKSLDAFRLFFLIASTMSGSSGSSFGSGYSGSEDVTCASLMEQVQISSPDPAVIDTLSIGDNLDVTLSDGDGPIQLLLLTDSGNIAGSIVPLRMASFIKCIKDGNNYVAIIQSISGGAVKVQVRHKS